MELQLDTQEGIEKAIGIYSAQSIALQHAIDKAKSQHMLPLMMVKDDVDKKLVEVTKMKK